MSGKRRVVGFAATQEEAVQKLQDASGIMFFPTAPTATRDEHKLPTLFSYLHTADITDDMRNILKEYPHDVFGQKSERIIVASERSLRAKFRRYIQ